MIDDPLPTDWKELQRGVRRLLRNIGLDAQTEIEMTTPRGKVEVDVLAVDVRSVDKIKYVIECKNWNAAIPQAVVHSFTTVMHETGANLGFIVSKHGLQNGAEGYTRNTNITGLTYLQLQQRYFEIWWIRYFCALVGDAADRVLDYVESFPSTIEIYSRLEEAEQVKFDRLRAYHSAPIKLFSTLNVRSLQPSFKVSAFAKTPETLEGYVDGLRSALPQLGWRCATFRELLTGILSYLTDVRAEFRAIFEVPDVEPITGVTLEGPSLDGS